MIQLRWVYRNGPPAQGWIPIGPPQQLVYQVLQYRQNGGKEFTQDSNGYIIGADNCWLEWKDVGGG